MKWIYINRDNVNFVYFSFEIHIQTIIRNVKITSHKRYFTVVLMAYFYVLKNEEKIKISKGVDEDKRINELFISYGNKYTHILICISNIFD